MQTEMTPQSVEEELGSEESPASPRCPLMSRVLGGGCQPSCGPADLSLGLDRSGLAGTLRFAGTSGSVPSWAVDGCPSWRDLPRAGRGKAVAQDKPPRPPAHGKPGSSPRVLGVGL